MIIRLCSTIAAAFVLCGCAGGAGLRTQVVQSQEVEGSYTLILYGARYSDDIQTLAILDLEADGYTFKVYAPDFDYKIRKGVPAKEALAEAVQFVSFHRSFQRPRISRIMDLQGRTIGYEVRPLYHTIDFPYSDVLDVHYGLAGGEVTVRIRLIPEVEFQREERPRPLFKGRR
jgi:hypothetical protein